MIFYISVLRAIAAILITNAHYTGIYPTDIIANGGLLGDVLFFAVSGYCLYNIRLSFPRWYGKRIIRCYLPVLITTAIYMAVGFYSLSEHSAFWWYIYPTYYHFVSSIILLYIPYFIVIKVDWLKNHLPLVMGIFGLVYIVIYLFVYDKTYYHIDNVRQPMIRFLFMESMFLGAWLKQNDVKYRNKFSLWMPFTTVIVFVSYFASKVLFSKVLSLCSLQVINQIVIFLLLYLLIRTFAGLDNRLERMPSAIKVIVSYLAKITLEIYVVQYVLIALIRPIRRFPLNWITLTASIIFAATVLHYVSFYLFNRGGKLISKIRKSETNL